MARLLEAKTTPTALHAIRGAKNGDTGLVEDAFSANIRIEFVEQLSDEHAVHTPYVVCNIARYIGRDDEHFWER